MENLHRTMNEKHTVHCLLSEFGELYFVVGEYCGRRRGAQIYTRSYYLELCMILVSVRRWLKNFSSSNKEVDVQVT